MINEKRGIRLIFSNRRKINMNKMNNKRLLNIDAYQKGHNN